MSALAEQPAFFKSTPAAARPRPASVPSAVAAAPPLVQARGVRKSFGGKTVITGVDLDLGAGEIVAIVGRSGCGKSTLLRLLAGLEGASGGDILRAGQRLTGLNRTARLMFQDANLLPWRTVLANVVLAAPAGPDRERIARQALSQVGLLDRADEWPAVLSGGQRQRVALARALASGAPLLFLDEPLGALDALTKIEMQALIERVWRERGFGALLITHDVEEAIALGDRVLVMEAGRFVLELAVGLPRPRRRSDPEFLALKERALARVLQTEAAAPAAA